MDSTLAKVGMRKKRDRRLQKKGVDDGQLTVVWMEDPRDKFSFSVVLSWLVKISASDTLRKPGIRTNPNISPFGFLCV